MLNKNALNESSICVSNPQSCKGSLKRSAPPVHSEPGMKRAKVHDIDSRREAAVSAMQQQPRKAPFTDANAAKNNIMQALAQTPSHHQGMMMAANGAAPYLQSDFRHSLVFPMLNVQGLGLIPVVPSCAYPNWSLRSMPNYNNHACTQLPVQSYLSNSASFRPPLGPHPQYAVPSNMARQPMPVPQARPMPNIPSSLPPVGSSTGAPGVPREIPSTITTTTTAAKVPKPAHGAASTAAVIGGTAANTNPARRKRGKDVHKRKKRTCKNCKREACQGASTRNGGAVQCPWCSVCQQKDCPGAPAHGGGLCSRRAGGARPPLVLTK